MPSVYHNQPRDAQLALTEYSRDFDKAFALANFERWIEKICLVDTTDAIRIVYPIPIGAAGYRERDGDDKMRRLYERPVSITPREWVDGVVEKAKIIEWSGDWIGWANAPAEMAFEAKRHPQILVADMLRRNPNLDFYRVEYSGGSVASARALFAADHPFNVLATGVGTFDNDWSAGDTVQGETVPATFNDVLVKQLRMHFRSIKGPNGQPLGLRFRGLLVPPAQAEAAYDAYERNALLEAVQNVAATENVAAGVMPNRFFGTEITVADELTGTLPSGLSGDDDTVYAYAVREGGGMQPPAGIVVESATPETIRYDKDSDFYKDTAMIGVKNAISAAAEGALPHAIVRINLTP
jgi:hypothetical protein